MILLVKDNCFTPVKDEWNIMTFMYISVGGALVADFKVVLGFFPKKPTNLGFQFVFSELGSRFSLEINYLYFAAFYLS